MSIIDHQHRGQDPIGNTVVVAFSFGLQPDASPGKCNVRIAAAVKGVLLADRCGANPWVGVQWEVYDALEEMQDARFHVNGFIPLTHVASPPPFREEDILQLKPILERLERPASPAEEVLSQKCLSIGVPTADPRDLAQLSDLLLYDPHLYEDFAQHLDFHDLYRLEKGIIGLEKRQMPNSDFYPRGVRRFQARRVNRFILEAIFPSSFLRRSKYLNTLSVARHMFASIIAEEFHVHSIVFFAHPNHRDWCAKNLLKAAAETGFDIAENDCFCGDNEAWGDASIWDTASAQVWCRSASNFRLYQHM